MSQYKGGDDYCRCERSGSIFDYTTFQNPLYHRWKSQMPTPSLGPVYVHVDCLLPGELWQHALHRYCFECGESFSAIVEVCEDCWDMLDDEGKPEPYPSWPLLATTEVRYLEQKFPKNLWRKRHKAVPL